MMQILAVLAAGGLFVAAVLSAPVPAVAALATVGLLLAGAGIIGAWPRIVGAAAAVSVTAYAIALGISAAPVRVLAGAGFGVALLLLLQCADLARRTRHARIGADVLRTQAGAWIGLGAGTLGAAMLGMALAQSLAGSLPHSAAAPVAAAAALGIVMAIAALMVRGRRRTVDPSAERGR
jgi:hypothetical protein